MSRRSCAPIPRYVCDLVELSHVSILLGHSSVRVTERHYSPWVKARQEQLEADVRVNVGQAGRQRQGAKDCDSLEGPPSGSNTQSRIVH